MKKEVIIKKVKTIGLKPITITFLDKGTSKDSYIITTKEKKYVLKLFDKEDKKKVQKQMNTLQKINLHKKITLYPIHKKVIILENKVGFVYEYVEGTLYRETKTKNKIYNFGKIVGRFNKETKKLTKKEEGYLAMRKDITRIKKALIILSKQKKLDSLHQETKKALEQALTTIKKEYKPIKIRKQIIHGDLHDGNVVYNKEKTIIIDLDGIQKRPLIEEIATFLSYFRRKTIKKYKEDITRYIKGYESEFKLLKKEKKILPIVLITRKIGEIKYLLKQEQNKKLTKKEITQYLGGSTTNLLFILNNFEELKKIYAKI